MNSLALILALALEISLILFLIVAGVFAIFSLVGAVGFAPYVSSGKTKAKMMLDLAGIGEGARILEIGSGDGILCLLAAERGAETTGIEINPVLVVISRIRARLWRVEGRCRFILGNMWRFRLPPDTQAVFVYGLPEFMGKLLKKLAAELPVGTTVVSHAFELPGKEPERTSGNIKLYRL